MEPTYNSSLNYKFSNTNRLYVYLVKKHAQTEFQQPAVDQLQPVALYHNYLQ